ncbi:restriction endonuclease subunit S [Lentisalinibacter orientalis]|uniref:restriction endonuclease subunit S n=1 Tax=Lentisalinibacter orientalis TaxID=2992241 RepID=UPI003863C16E
MGDADEVTFAPMEALFDGLGGLDVSRVKPLAELASGSYNYFAEGDILLAKVTPCFESGKKAIARNLTNGVGFATSEVHVIRADRSKIETRFLRYLLCSEDFRAEGMRSMTGAGGLRRVSENAILDFRPKITDKKIQRAIADFLDRETARIDQLIQKKERLVEVVDEKRSSMITAAVTGRVDPAAAGHSPPKGIAKHGQLSFDALPSDWSVRRIKTISPVMRGASPRPIDDPAYFDERGEYAWVRISDVTASKGLLLETAQRLSERGAAKSVKLGIGELFLSIAGSVGKPCITGIKACIHDGFVYFPFLPKDSQKFLYWIFESHECFSGLGKLGTQLNLNTETVGNIAIPFPPISTQRTLAEFLDDRIAEIDRLRERMLNSVDRLREFRAALITAAVTGQIDVKTWGKKGTTDRRLDQIEESMSA